MREYPKIETLFDRDPQTRKVKEGVWRTDEFRYLAGDTWIFTEKIDGTNVRVGWDGSAVTLGGRTDNAQMPVPLVNYLQSVFTAERFMEAFGPDWEMGKEVVLYGEGFGPKIQNGGAYRDTVAFALFDVVVANWWLRLRDIEDVACKFGIPTVPVVGDGELSSAVDKVKAGFASEWGTAKAEGLVVRPYVDLWDRRGRRIIGKIKTRDFEIEQ